MVEGYKSLRIDDLEEKEEFKNYRKEAVIADGSKLGRNSFGIVYRVRRKTDGKIFALKVTHDEITENILREVAFLKHVKDPSIIGMEESF
jgi:hypothetical protein